MRIGTVAGVTDTGRRRRRNEDAYVCEPPLFAVADGMGGAQAGEVASRLAAAVVEEDDGGGASGEERVAELIREANRRVYRRSAEDPSASGMGTTMTVALVDPSGEAVVFGHVGDSRAYRVRAGRLEQLTEDHSLVAELMRSGKLSPEEAEVHPQRSVITRALGTDPDVDVDTFTVEAQPGDLYLICSDGLSSMLGDEEILRVVSGADGLTAATKALVNAANRSGGEDNITVVVFEIAEGEDASLEETVRIPAAGRNGAADDDTLSGLEAVPAVDTMVVTAEDVRQHLESVERAGPAATARRPKRQPNRVLPLVLLLLALAVVVVLVAWGIAR